MIRFLKKLIKFTAAKTGILTLLNKLRIFSFKKYLLELRISRVQNIKQLRRLARDNKNTYFLDYDLQIDTKIREFTNSIKAFDIDLNNKVILDIGTGTSDSLDCALKMGALETYFIDSDIYFDKFAKLKGHKGLLRDYMIKPYFPEYWRKKFDVIYTKGSINCILVNEMEKTKASSDFSFDEWVMAIKSLLKKEGKIILLPAMGKQSMRIIDEKYDLDTFYWCDDVESFRQSYFTKTLLNNGFKIHENIEGVNQSKAFPFLYYYQK
tara:strand:+ start:651 stop:1448 length:798 start_codon:yes stop_codon:yes gene_type:complete